MEEVDNSVKGMPANADLFALQDKENENS